MNLIETNFEVKVYIKQDESWTPVKYPGVNGSKYMISNHGRVKNIKNNKILKPFPDGKGSYLYISFASIDNKKKRKNVSIHRLVAWHFVDGYTDERNEVNHKDNNPQNNYYENLEWMTHAENNQYMNLQNRNSKQKEIFTERMKTNNPNKNYSDEIVISICHLLNDGWDNITIAYLISEKFLITNDVKLTNYISGIKSGFNRPQLSKKYLKEDHIK